MDRSEAATRLLGAIEQGDERSAHELLDVVYDELRDMAAAMFRGEPSQTLQPTALVHEAYQKLAAGNATYRGESHFLAVAATAMRQVLIDRARSRGCLKRGGSAGANRSLGGGGDLIDSAEEPVGDVGFDDVLALDEVLTALARIDERKARIVELRFFAGMTVEQVAEVVALSPTTVKSEWRFARAWLGAQLSSADSTTGSTQKGPCDEA